MRMGKLKRYVAVFVGVFLSVGYPKAYSSVVPTFNLPFKGEASGGNLILAKTRNRNVAYVSVQTSTGESAESVAQRLADTINAHHAEQNFRGGHYDPHWLWVGGYQVSASGSNLILPGTPENYITSGTEMGLGIPKPPMFLSCSYDKGKNEVALQWINPPDRYDFILVEGYWNDFDEQVTRLLPRESNTFRIERNKIPVDVNDLEFRVISLSDNIPSNAAAIHVSGGGHCQEETYGIPFTGGVAPNWATWSTAEKPDTAAFEQGEKYTNLRQSYNPARTLSTKPFYQVVKTPPSGAAHGVYRKFLSLTPGHTYRIIACISTLEMDSVKGDWAFSLHGTHNGAERKDLTIQQLSGLAALPDGRRGPQAGRIAYYHRGKTTKANHEIVFSGDKAASEVEDASHITLPADANTITVWVRFTCSDTNGKVGFSGIKLEDITASGNVKSPEQIMLEEHQEEAGFLTGIERMLRKESP